MVGKGKRQKKPLHEYPEKTVATKLFTHMGMNSMQLHSIHVLDDTTLLSFAANTVQFVNLATGSITCVPGPEGGGIGAVCVHPSRRFYTVCEKRPANPEVVVHEYPSKKVRATLRHGAERGYSACRFSDSGTMLATVAIEPDFVLTLWNWETEAIILRNKAFGADVYNVAFNKFNDGLIVTSGSGHIKFWSMSNTFTGLKLQGHVGKFGRTEISDISAFVSMPDGKVISGSENGSLLLWEGNLIKCELGRARPDDEDAPVSKCHAGNILVVELVEQDRLVLTGGDDGCLRYWSLEEIDLAENSGTDAPTAIKLVHEIVVGDGVRIRCVSRSVDGQFWIVLDAAGAIRKVPYKTYDAIMHAANAAAPATPATDRAPLLRFNSGGVNAVAPSPFDHTCVTAGRDGTLRQLDYISRSEQFQLKFETPASDVRYLRAPQDSSHRHLFATFDDGSIAILRRARNTFEIVSHLRPHSARIVAWSMDNDCKQLWTVAEDKSAFYFTVSPSFALDAVGYCELPQPPTCAEFTHAGDRLCVGFKSGAIIALQPPDAANIDRDVGFKFEARWEGVAYRQKQKPPEKEKKLSIDPSEVQEPSSSDDDLLAEEVDVGPWAVRFIKQLPAGTMLVGLEQPELCYEYNLTRRYPDNAMGPPPLPSTGLEPQNWVEEPMRNLAFRDTTIRGATVSWSGSTLALRTNTNGVILRPVKRLETCTHATQLHDALSNTITGADMAFDDRVLLTVGRDGMLFAHELSGVEPPSAAEVADSDARLPVAAVPKAAAIPNSIQAQKELDDQRRAEEAALGKKEQLLRKIRLIHDEYDKILDENEAAVGGKQLSADELVLDPELLEILENKKQEAVAQAHKEYEWQSAKKQALLKKLMDAFVNTLQWERFELHGFDNGVVVSAFRAAHLTEAQRRVPIPELLSREHGGAFDDEQQFSDVGSGAGSPVVAPTSPGRSPTSDGGLMPQPEHADPEVEGKAALHRSEKTATSTAVKSQLEKAEERKRERIARKRGLEELMARNPENLPPKPKDLARIERARRRMGDYRLKTSAAYEVPEHLQPTAQRKAVQLNELEAGINFLRCQFNEKLIQLRDNKRAMCERMNEDKRRIKHICDQLGMEADDALFALQPIEEPEKRFEIDRAGLEKFGEEQEKAKRKREALERAKKGFGSDLATMEDDDDDHGHARGRRHSVAGVTAVPNVTAGAPLGPREKFELDLKARADAIRRSELEEEEWLVLREQLLFEKSRLERRIRKSIKAFDASVNDLYQEKLKLESDLCMADMRVLLLFREYLKLLLFRERDEELTKERSRRVDAYKDVADRLRQRQEHLMLKRAELEDCDAITAELKDEYNQLIEEYGADAHKAALDAIYNKKIRRRRVDDDDDDDDESSSSDDSEEEDDEEWAEEGDDQCPAGVEEEIFTKVLAVRSRRLDQQDRKAELTKASNDLEKQIDDLSKKENAAKNDLQATVEKERKFKREKQEQLNELETIVVLKLSQMRCLDENRRMPRVLTNDYVVFTEDGLSQLQQRIVDLGHEKEQLELEAKQLDQDMLKLARKRAKRYTEYQEWDGKVYEVQLLKFGQRVNLEMLENVAVDRETEELKAQLKAEEIRWERELNKQQERLAQLKLQQQHRIAENTACLKDLGTFRAEQRDLEEALQGSASKIVAKMTGGSKVATAADRAHLKDLVVAQQQEIDALKNEIAMLRRKGGHVYTPVVNKVAPPPPPAAA